MRELLDHARKPREKSAGAGAHLRHVLSLSGYDLQFFVIVCGVRVLEVRDFSMYFRRRAYFSNFLARETRDATLTKRRTSRYR